MTSSVAGTAGQASSATRRISLLVFLAVSVIFCGSFVRADEGDDQYAVAASFYAQKQWQAAAEEFGVLLDRYPHHTRCADGIFYLGEVFLQSGQFDKAQNHFDRYLSEHPTGKFRRAAAFRAAETAYLASNHSKAEPLLQEFRRRYPQDALNAYVLPYLGFVAIAENNAKAAETHFREALQRFPRGQMREECRLGLARTLAVQGRRGEAEELFRALAANSGRLAEEAQFRFGAMLYEAGQYAESAQVLEKVAQSDSSENRHRDQALLLRASALVKLARFAEAVGPLLTFLDARHARKDDEAENTRAESEIRALGLLAICQLRAGNFAAAKTCHARLLEDHVGHELLAPTIEQMAQDALAIGESVWSARLFEWLAEDCGREEYKISGLAGLAWSRLGNNQKALANVTFERLLLEEPEPALAAEAAYTRGRLLEEMERFDAALAMYDKVIRHHPSGPQHPKALLAAARVRVQLSLWEEAVGLYRRLAEEYPQAENADTVLYEWSWALQDLGRHEDAMALLARLYREHPGSRFRSDAAYRLAADSFDAGDFGRCNELLDQIIAVKPKNAAATATESDAHTALVFGYALRLKWQIAALQEDWRQVERIASLLLQECPQSDLRLPAEYWVAESLYRRGEFESAAKRFDDLAERAADMDVPWPAMICLRRGQILAQQTQWNRALELASKISERFPEFEQLYEVDYLLGRCRAARGEFEEARRAYERVIRSPQGCKTETAAMAEWMIGETYFHQKDYRRALKAYHRVEVLYDYPRWQSAALLQAAKCQRLLGRRDEAARLERRLLEKYPDSPFAKEAARLSQTPRKQPI